MKLTEAQRRGLEAVRAGKAYRVYTSKGNTVECKDVAAAVLYRLEAMKLIREGKGTGRFSTRLAFELTAEGEQGRG